MDSIKNTLAIVSLVALAFYAVAADEFNTITDTTKFREPKEITVTPFVASEFRSRGLVLDNNPVAGVSVVAVTVDEYPTIFHTGHWFASLGAAKVNTEITPGETTTVFAQASVGMYGQLLPNSSIMYNWSVFRSMTNRDGDANNVKFGVSNLITDHIMVGSEIGRSLDLPQKQVSFGNVFTKYEISPGTWVMVKRGWQTAGVTDRYSYNELNIEKTWNKEWTTKLAYFFVDAGKKFNQDLTHDGAQFVVMYNF